MGWIKNYIRKVALDGYHSSDGFSVGVETKIQKLHNKITDLDKYAGYSGYLRKDVQELSRNLSNEKKEREKLEDQLNDKIEELKFRIEFPARHNVGDRPIKGFVVTGVSLSWDNHIDFNVNICRRATSPCKFTRIYKWSYTLVNTKTGEQKVIEEGKSDYAEKGGKKWD